MPARYLPGLLALAPLATFSALARERAVLPPSGPWHLNYSEDSCQLLRRFGEGDRQVHFYLEQFEPGTKYNVRLIGKPFKSPELATRIRLGESETTMLAVGALSGTVDKQPMVAFNMAILPEPPPAEQTQPMASAIKARIAQGDGKTPFGIMSAAALRQLYVDPPAGPMLALQTGPMDKTATAMQTCMDGLIRHWGFDPATQRSLSRPVTPLVSPGEWIKSDDYPRSSLNKGQSAIVNFRLTVESDGSVTGCTIQRATQGDGFAERTCQAIRSRARFAPALDAAGKPVAAYYVSAVRWIIAG